jgi:predicted transglutaminase-like cysteine proteinase
MQTVENVFGDVRRDFIYTPDSEQFKMREDWRIHVDEVEAGQVWRDDCDGFACTSAELLIKHGIARERVSLMMCRTETGGLHLVCGVQDGEGIWYILDNRQRRVIAKFQVAYKWLGSMLASEPGIWREGDDSPLVS